MPAITDLRGAHTTALALGTGAGGVAAVANPEGVDLIITNAFLDITEASDGAGTVDAGVAANATTSADTLIDGQSVNAIGVILSGTGTNGKRGVKWGTDEYLTVSQASGAVAGMAGFLYVQYVRAAS